MSLQKVVAYLWILSFMGCSARAQNSSAMALNLPDSPDQYVASSRLAAKGFAVTSSALNNGESPEVSGGTLENHAHANPPGFKLPIGKTFWVANGLLFGSTIANAEMIARCRPERCQLMPDALRSRSVLYGIGIPASLGISYISYRMKRRGTKLWIVPVALFTSGNVAYAAHAAQYSR